MLVAGLCLDYKIYDIQIWNGVLQQLVHFGLVRSSFVYCTSVKLLYFLLLVSIQFYFKKNILNNNNLTIDFTVNTQWKNECPHWLTTESLFSQMEKLEYVLGRLNAAPEVWQAPIFPKAWQTLLVTPLTKGTCKYIVSIYRWFTGM